MVNFRKQQATKLKHCIVCFFSYNDTRNSNAVEPLKRTDVKVYKAVHQLLETLNVSSCIIRGMISFISTVKIKGIFHRKTAVCNNSITKQISLTSLSDITMRCHKSYPQSQIQSRKSSSQNNVSLFSKLCMQTLITNLSS